jgi:hypothetical protein
MSSLLYDWLYRWIQTALFRYQSSTLQEDKTKVIVVLNTDTVRTIQGVHNKDELPTISIDEGGDEEKKPGRIALRLKHIPDANVSVIGHTDHNMLSFVMNILLSHKLKSIVILKKSDIPEQREDEDSDKQDILMYEPSRAERSYLEERF